MGNNHICPWQGGGLLTISLRKLFNNPNKIMMPYLSEGMSAADIGCGMGFFTIPMSKMAGERGNVIAIDIQSEMLDGLKQKAMKNGCSNITPHLCDASSLHAEQWKLSVDFALLFWMLHEVPDAERLIREIHEMLVLGGRLLFVEPMVHVGNASFQRSLSLFKKCGFTLIEEPKISISRAAAFQKG